MNVLHLLSSGGIGGIETLCKGYVENSVHHNTIVFLWGGGIIADEMIQMGFDVVNLQTKKKNYLAQFRRIKKLCIDKKIDVVIAHHADPFSHFCLIKIKQKLPEIKTIAYAHGNALDMARVKHKFAGKLKMKLLSASTKKANRVVAISQSVKDSLQQYFKTPENKISVVYNGVDITKFKRIEKDYTSLRIIYVGRLIELKGVQLTLQALVQIGSINYHFKIVGDGPYKKDLQDMVKELGIAEKVEFLGSRRDVPELLQAANVFIHMPIWEEGFGISVIEAMASGLICICANNGAIPEIIDDNIDGYLVKKNNIIELAEKLKMVALLKPDDISRISENAVKKAEVFSIKNFASNLDDLVLKL